jgi:SAM-dependent methyltransferase
MQPGSDSFYTWVTTRPNYYPKQRWEWDSVKALISDSVKGTRPRVIDVGCGGGDFMAFLSSGLQADVSGLDTTPSSVEACRQKGLAAYCGDIDAFVAANPSGKFDFCVTFHCIEHIADPLGFMRQSKRLLADGGKLVVSAPYSPMSFELTWFDPLNHPPHHLTRWNAASLEALASQLDMKLTLLTSPAAPSYSRALRGLQLARGDQNRTLSIWEKLLLAMKRPGALANSLLGQLRRETRQGEAVGDIFLAVLEAKRA